MAVLLQVEELEKNFGELLLFDNVSFSISEGDKIGLIAHNGAGKTTLLNILAGKESINHGNIIYKKGLKISYLEQDPHFDPKQTVIEACFNSGNEITEVIKEYEAIMNSNQQDGLDLILQKMDLLQAWEYEFKIKQILAQLKIVHYHQKIENLSGGQLKRIALANVLITEPDLIILDEPTNHLDLDMVEWLEGYLQRSRLALLMVTHDRYFLDKVCTQILEIDLQKIYRYKGSYSYFLEKRQERLSTQQQELDKSNNLLRKELDWMRRQPKARGTKSKSRIEAFYELEKKAQQKREESSLELKMKGQYIGNKIFEAHNVSKSFPGIEILQNFNYVFARYEKMGIVGNNGTGKSTFIKMLMNQIQPDSGHFEVGDTIKFGYYSQDGLEFDNQMKVIDVIKNIAEVIDWGDGNKMTASQFLQHFMFSPSKQQSFVYKLSGGERRRLYLCSVLISNPNFLVLDEPTNDLDIQTLNVLEEYLVSFKGCVIVVSHDRYFMDKVVDHILAFKGQAEIKDFPGNYSDYREWDDLQKSINEKEKLEEVENKPETVIREAKSDKKKKLTYKEKLEFESLEKDITDMEAEKTELEETMSSGLLDTNDLLAKSERISIIIDLLDSKTARWVELSEYL